jgi:uncharacterized protein involved in cysteine biosynthesis
MIPFDNWVTPLMMGAFLLTAVTGILMFFEVDTALNVIAHEWFSWLLVGGTVAHIIANYHSLKWHLQGRLGSRIVAVFAVVLVASFFSFGNAGVSSLRSAIFSGIVDAKLETVAVIAKTTPDALIQKLIAHGTVVNSANQTLHELSGDNAEKEKELIHVVFAEKP